jgi:hypothetical protein
MALHLFGGEYDMEDLEDPDDVGIIREQGDDDRPVDVVDFYKGRTPDTNALMDELAHDLSVRELKALERRIRKDRIFAELAASYDEGHTTALEIARQAGISVRKDVELTKEPPKIRRRRPGQSRKLHRGRKRLH